MAMASLTSFCPHCRAQVPVEDGQPISCPSCGHLVNGTAWYYAKNRQKIGPVCLTNLQQLAVSGELQPSDMVLQDETKKWVTAGTISELFRTQGAAPSDMPLPEAVATVSQAAHQPCPFSVAEPVTASKVATTPAATLSLPPAASADPVPAVPVLPMPVAPSPAATLSLPPETLSAATSPAATLSLDTHPPAPPVARQTIATEPPLLASLVSVEETLPSRIGRFDVRQRLGEGAFGVVYRAYDSQLDREVALKVAKPHMLNTEKRVKRFLREAKAAANLRHPNIVPVFDSGKDGDQYYIAAAFIPGKSLASALEEQPAGQGLEIRRAVEIVRRLAEALAYAHSKGVVHRDVKSANAMLDDQGEPMLLDFGLAVRVEGDEKLTQEATMMGTPSYMAPEQAAGLAEAASDQYSLGCTLYESLTGQTPFSGPPEIQIFLHQTQEPPTPRKFNPKLPRDLETICLKCLAKKPGERYVGCRELADDLRRWLEREPITARSIGRLERLWRWGRRNPALAAASGLAAVLAVVVTLVSIWSAVRARSDASQLVQANEERALSQVTALLDANPQAVPNIIEGLEPFRDTVNPRLRELIAQPELIETRRVRVSLALLPIDPGQVKYLYGRMLEAEPQEGVVIRDALQARKQDLIAGLWTEFDNPRNDAGRRLRAACALAAYDLHNQRWEKVSTDVAKQLVVENPLVLGMWIEALRPVSDFLLPPLAAFLEDEKRSGTERYTIATIYNNYAREQADAFARLEKKLAEQPNPNTSPDERTVLFKQQANVGAALMAIGRGGKVWPLLKHTPDPTLRSYMIERVSSASSNLKALVGQMEKEQDVSIRRAIILSMGQFDSDNISSVEREQLNARLLRLYQDDPDPGMHGAAEWLLRRWKQEARIMEIEQKMATGKVEGKRLWYINKQGQTMVIVRGQHQFAIASKEATVEQFIRFRKGQSYTKEFASTVDCPINNVTWYDATAYCNWLSEQERIPKEEWCYEPNHSGQYAEGMTIVADYLNRLGYRLPTEAEWELACRAGSSTSRPYGETKELLGQYAWFAGNNSAVGSRPVGILKPNDLGVFDMLGNVHEWCQDRTGAAQNTNEQITAKEERAIRGGAFLNQPSLVRSASRTNFVLSNTGYSIGFRPAKTITP